MEFNNPALGSTLKRIIIDGDEVKALKRNLIEFNRFN
jgi:hypothetical protein